MDIPEHIKPFWSAFLAKIALAGVTPLYGVFHFADREAVASSLADLVLRGEKVATASLLWEYEAEGRRAPQRGDLSVVTSWDALPLCVIETTEVQVQAFEDVDEEFAAAEGEGDRSLAFWREAHWSYFGCVCEELRRERSWRMPVVCERFRVVFAQAKDDERHR
jgi:uncharacterized protein YhfF